VLRVSLLLRTNKGEIPLKTVELSVKNVRLTVVYALDSDISCEWNDENVRVLNIRGFRTGRDKKIPHGRREFALLFAGVFVFDRDVLFAAMPLG